MLTNENSQLIKLEGRSGKILGLKAPNQDKNYERIISIGDIHGCLDSLKFLLENLSITKKDLIIFLGDYVDRGPNSPDVIEYLLDLNESQQPCVFIRGNHDGMMLSYLGLGGMYGDYWTAECNGGDTTVFQYAKNFQGSKHSPMSDPFPSYIQNTLDDHKIPKVHAEFLMGTLMYCELDNMFYSHAGFDSRYKSWEYDKQSEESYTWTREGFLGRSHKKMLNKLVVHGHTINRPDFKPYYREQDNQINLDSGCFHKGTLSALIVYPAMNNMNESVFAVSNVENKTFELEKINGKYRK